MTFCHYELNQQGSGPFLFSAHPLKRFIFQEIIKICHQVRSKFSTSKVYGPRLAEIFRGVIRLSKWARALAMQTEKGNGPHSANVPPWEVKPLQHSCK